MPTYNYKARELIAKIVYYGPGRCGKTTNLQQIHAKMRPETRSDLLSVATETDRTIYFDLLPLNLGTINGMKFMVRLFTVPGQVYYAETRKLVLRGTDGVVFVADSQDHMIDENRESLRDLKTNLAANGIDYATIPLVLQYNKRDLQRLTPEAELDAVLNDRLVKALGAVASQGNGVLETLRFVTVGVFNHIKASTGTQTGASGARSRSSSGTPEPLAARTLSSEHSSTATQPLPTLPEAFGSPSRDLTPPPYAPSAPGGNNTQTATRGATRSAALESALAAARTAARAATGSNAPSGPSVAAPAPMWPAPRNGPAVERPPPPPATIGSDLWVEEFKSLALMQSQLSERLAMIEQEVKRLGRENQEMRERLARRSD